jgi:hypothetical protein
MRRRRCTGWLADRFTDRGLRELKGLSEARRVYLVEPSGRATVSTRWLARQLDL